jgi:hypothetical protein
MIEKIRELFENGHPMRLASKAGVRQIQLQDGSIVDPLGEMTAYILEPSYDGKTTLRLYSGNTSMGYVQHKKEGAWSGNNRSTWLEMNPIDRSVWLDLRNYSPTKKDNVVNPHIEPIRDVANYKDHKVVYDWEPASEDAVVLLVYHTNSRYEEILPLLAAEGRDLIVEIDSLPIAGKAAVVKRVKELAPAAHVVEHDVQFGLGYLVVNAHKNVFEKYKRAAFFTDELSIAPGAADLGFNMLTQIGNNSQCVVSLLGPAIDSEDIPQGSEFSYTTQRYNLGGYFLDSETNEVVTAGLKYYAETFLQSKYESRPHHSIRKWLKDQVGVYQPEAPTGVKDVILHLLTLSNLPVYRPVNPRAVTSGQPYTNKGDSKRKKFTEVAK